MASENDMAFRQRRCKTAFIFTRWYNQFNSRSRGFGVILSRSQEIILLNEYTSCVWLSARLRYLPYVSNGDTTILHETIDVIELNSKGFTNGTKYVPSGIGICSLNINLEIWHSGVFHSPFHMHLRCKKHLNGSCICLRQSTTVCFKETHFCNWISRQTWQQYTLSNKDLESLCQYTLVPYTQTKTTMSVN